MNYLSTKPLQFEWKTQQQQQQQRRPTTNWPGSAIALVLRLCTSILINSHINLNLHRIWQCTDIIHFNWFIDMHSKYRCETQPKMLLLLLLPLLLLHPTVCYTNIAKSNSLSNCELRHHQRLLFSFTVKRLYIFQRYIKCCWRLFTKASRLGTERNANTKTTKNRQPIHIIIGWE